MSELTCKDCGAGVAIVDEGMMCHCRFIPWRSTTPSQVLDAATVERCDCIDLEALTYDELWGAIAAATRVEAGIVAISVVKFREALRALATDPHQHGWKGA